MSVRSGERAYLGFRSFRENLPRHSALQNPFIALLEQDSTLRIVRPEAEAPPLAADEVGVEQPRSRYRPFPHASRQRHKGRASDLSSPERTSLDPCLDFRGLGAQLPEDTEILSSLPQFLFEQIDHVVVPLDQCQVECGLQFVFVRGEQVFHDVTMPKRCRPANRCSTAHIVNSPIFCMNTHSTFKQSEHLNSIPNLGSVDQSVLR